MFFYSDSREPFTGRPVPYHEQEATRHWLTHFSNSLYLTFFAQNETDGAARAQARKELGIAETKMTFWRRHVNFNQAEATRGAEVLKQKWRQPR